MITNFVKHKIPLLLVIAIILFIYALIPHNNGSTTYQDVFKEYIYLLNEDNYLERTCKYVSNNDPINNIKEKIELLTINSNKAKLLLDHYEPLIPINTKINDLTIEGDMVKINFSKELLNVSLKNEEKMLEAIIYTITENNIINKVMIFVDGEILNQLPNSKKNLPSVLTRDYGINKNYNLSDYKNTNKTTIYYLSNQNNYIPVTFINNDSQEKIEIIINELKTSSLNQTNLISFLKANAVLEDYEILENTINLSFNQYIFDNFSNKVINEEVKYAIYLSIKDTYHIEEVNYLYDNELISKVNKI